MLPNHDEHELCFILSGSDLHLSPAINTHLSCSFHYLVLLMLFCEVAFKISIKDSLSHFYQDCWNILCSFRLKNGKHQHVND